MTDIKSGLQTSEFKLGSLILVITTFGEQIGLFNTSMFEEDPTLSLIYRSIQLLVLGGITVAYINGRSSIKTNEQTPAPVILENRES